jgi:hypothetical protein
MTNTARPSDAGGIGEVEALCAELVAELREMRDTVRLYRETIADAARYIARGLADRLTLPVADPRGHELAAALARMGGVGAEVDAQQPVESWRSQHRLSPCPLPGAVALLPGPSPRTPRVPPPARDPHASPPMGHRHECLTPATPTTHCVLP